MEWKELMASRLKERQKEQVREQEVTKVVVSPKPKYEPAVPGLDREQKKTLQRQQRQLEKTEALIDDLKTKKAAIELEMSSPDTYARADKFTELEKSYTDIKKQLAKAENDYESIFEQILELESGL